jgi:hypothetical protein
VAIVEGDKGLGVALSDEGDQCLSVKCMYCRPRPLTTALTVLCRSRSTKLRSIQLLLSRREDAVVIAKHDYFSFPSVDLI